MAMSDTAARLFRHQAGKCHYCRIDMRLTGMSDRRVTVDHVVPACRGGTRAWANVRGACWACNNARGAMPYEAFREYVEAFGRPQNEPGGICGAASERLAWAIARQEKRAALRAVAGRPEPWNRKPSAMRAYVDDVGKYPILAEALAALKKS